VLKDPLYLKKLSPEKRDELTQLLQKLTVATEKSELGESQSRHLEILSNVLAGATVAAVAGLAVGVAVWIITGSALVPGVGIIVGAFLGTVFVALRSRSKYNLLNNPWSHKVKRLLDIVIALMGAWFLLPLLGVIALLIRLDSKGPVVQSHQRVGLNEQLFKIYKFRTTHIDAERQRREFFRDNPELKAEFERSHKLRIDPGITRMGRFLRSTSLDELPQLWNVLKGEMSLVGPRPYTLPQAKNVTAAQKGIFLVPPGITGPWQVSGHTRTSFDDRVRMDTYYVRNWSIWLDLVILARSIVKVFFVRDIGLPVEVKAYLEQEDPKSA
jgi:lipopolysaccharide/colanic/teichoic acid biosynthesis glycosyltransferase